MEREGSKEVSKREVDGVCGMRKCIVMWYEEVIGSEKIEGR